MTACGKSDIQLKAKGPASDLTCKVHGLIRRFTQKEKKDLGLVLFSSEVNIEIDAHIAEHRNDK